MGRRRVLDLVLWVEPVYEVSRQGPVAVSIRVLYRAFIGSLMKQTLPIVSIVVPFVGLTNLYS